MLVADADGAPLDGARNCLCHFAAGELPPVDAFWSVTMHDQHGFQSGLLGITMRLYAPHPEALDGRWNPPPVRRTR